MISLLNEANLYANDDRKLKFGHYVAWYMVGTVYQANSLPMVISNDNKLAPIFR